MQIQEFCDIQAEGRSPYPFMNAVRRSPVACGNQYCKGRIFYFRIARKDLPEIQASCRNLSYKTDSFLSGIADWQMQKIQIPDRHSAGNSDKCACDFLLLEYSCRD